MGRFYTFFISTYSNMCVKQFNDEGLNFNVYLMFI